MYPVAFFGTPSGGEILLVLAVVLMLFGAKNLPKMARTLGRTLEEFRRAARDVSDEILHADDAPSPSPKGLIAGGPSRQTRNKKHADPEEIEPETAAADEDEAPRTPPPQARATPSHSAAPAQETAPP